MRLPIPRLESYYARWNAVAPLKLSASSGDSLSLEELLDLADLPERRLWERLQLGYASSWGLAELREAAGALCGGLGGERVLTFAGAQEGLFCSYLALIEPGDHVVTLRPCYEFLETIPRALGADVTTVPLAAGERGFELDLDLLETSLRPDTRLIAINFPHNPTGAVLAPGGLERIVELARRSDAWLLSDEVFRLLTHGKAEPPASALTLYERAVALDVMSKSFGLGGVRVGWIASRSEQALERIAAVKAYSSICNGAPDEVLALIALKNAEPILARNCAVVESNLALASACFERFPELLRWSPPAAGCLGFPELSAALAVDELAERLAHRAGVLMLPAKAFLSEENRFRLGFGLKSFPQALEAFAAELASPDLAAAGGWVTTS